MRLFIRTMLAAIIMTCVYTQDESLGKTDSWSGWNDRWYSAVIRIYLDLNNGTDACSSGTHIGDITVQITDRRVSLRDKPGVSDFDFRWGMNESLIIQSLKNGTGTFCGRIQLNEYIADDGSRYVLVPPEEQKYFYGEFMSIGWPSFRLTVKGTHVDVEPFKACCNSKQKSVRHIPWGKKCPRGTKHAGKASTPNKCKPADEYPDPYPDYRVCCFPNKYCSREDSEENCLKLGKGKSVWLKDVKYCGPPDPCNGIKYPAFEPPSQPPEQSDEGACHLPCPNDYGKECLTTTRNECAVIKGGRFEPGDQCPLVAECPQEEQGCCIQGRCRNMTPMDCGLNYGEPIKGRCTGDDKKDCRNVTGACIIEGKCDDGPYTKAECEQGYQGRYLGNKITCESAKRACCDNKSGECTLTLEEECTGEKTFLNDVKTCEPNQCQKPKGGCCDNKSECTEATEVECTGTFFPDGCPAECPEIWGACTVPCPSSPFEICENTAGKNCATFENSSFVPDEMCPEDSNKDCVCCSEAFGMWTLSRNNETADLVLNSDCTGTMKITKEERVGGGDLAITKRVPTKTGTWTCLEDVITALWPDNTMSNLIMVWEGSVLKLCYMEGSEIICAENVPVSVIHKENREGVKLKK